MKHETQEIEAPLQSGAVVEDRGVKPGCAMGSTGGAAEKQDHPDPGKLADLLVATSRATMLDMSEKLQEVGLSYKKFHLLGHLEDTGPVRMGDIAGKLGVTVAASTGIIDGLEKLKYVARIPDPDDRRKVLVQVSPVGKRVLAELHGTIQDLVAQAIEDDSKRVQLQKLVEEFYPLGRFEE